MPPTCMAVHDAGCRTYSFSPYFTIFYCFLSRALGVCGCLTLVCCFYRRELIYVDFVFSAACEERTQCGDCLKGACVYCAAPQYACYNTSSAPLSCTISATGDNCSKCSSSSANRANVLCEFVLLLLFNACLGLCLLRVTGSTHAVSHHLGHDSHPFWRLH